MLKIKPRPYQGKAVNSVHEQLAEYSSTLLVMATGLGKTICFSLVAAEFLKRGKIMVLAHRGELITQAYGRLKDITGYEPDIEMADYHIENAGMWQSPVVVSTIQTQNSGMGGGGRMTKFDPDEFSLLIIDEAHHSTAKSYKRIVDYYQQNPELKVLGVTATPDRTDKEALGQVFKTVAFEYDILSGINDGWLVPIKQRCVYIDDLDFSGIRTTAGDLNGADLSRVMEAEQAIHEIAVPTIELTGDRKTLVFAASIAQAERLTEVLNRYKNDSARFVFSGTDTDERRRMFRDYAGNKFQYLVNVGITTEGFDDPGVEVVCMARPTKSRSLYTQMAGRGTRVLPYTVDDLDEPEQRRRAIANSLKSFVEVIDFVGNAGRHKLMSSADILAGKYSEDVIERVKEKAKKTGTTEDVLDELEKAQEDLIREKEAQELRLKEEAERAKIKAQAKFRVENVDPFDVFDLKPKRTPGHMMGKPPTDKQINFLERNGVAVDSRMDLCQASQIIDKIIENREQKKASYKMIKILKKYGYMNADEMGFTEAGQLIQQIRENGWRRV